MTMPSLMKITMILMIIMLMMMIIMSTLVSFIHPLILIMTMISYTTLSLILMFFSTSMSMYMFMIFISIVGGMMIMFLYFTSMINNYPSKVKLTELMMIFYLIFMMMLMICTYMYMNMSYLDPEMLMNNKMWTPKTFIFKIYLYPLNILTTFTVINLLYCLILTIKMCSSKYLPLRKINYEKI